MVSAIKHPVPDRVKPSLAIFDIWVPERQSAQMSKIANDGQSGTGCFITVPICNSGSQRVNLISLWTLSGILVRL